MHLSDTSSTAQHMYIYVHYMYIYLYITYIMYGSYIYVIVCVYIYIYIYKQRIEDKERRASLELSKDILRSDLEKCQMTGSQKTKKLSEVKERILVIARAENARKLQQKETKG